jgi:hypothetical protein
MKYLSLSLSLSLSQDFTFAKQALSHLSHTSSPFALLILDMAGGGVSRTISPGWPWTMILPITASHVARITGVSHQLYIYIYIFLKETYCLQCLQPYDTCPCVHNFYHVTLQFMSILLPLHLASKEVKVTESLAHSHLLPHACLKLPWEHTCPG